MRLLLCNAPVSEAKRLARFVVDECGAACVNLIGPIVSVYRWQDKLCEDEEITLVIKVAAARAQALVDALVEAHPYELPEVVSLSVDEALSYTPYVQWVASV